MPWQIGSWRSGYSFRKSSLNFRRLVGDSIGSKQSFRPLGLGLLGAARITPRAIIEPAKNDPAVRLVAVGARSFSNASEFAERHGIARAAQSYMDVIDDPEVDAVYVALPPALHAQWTCAALDRGKAVLCEKPIATTLAEVERMTAAARQAGVPLIEGFHYRFHDAFRAVERMLAADTIGEIRSARANFLLDLRDRPGDFRWEAGLGGGALWDLGCYAVHALRTLLGEPQIVAARGNYRQGVDAATGATLRFGEIEADISCSMVAPAIDATLELVGDQGSIALRNYVAPQLGHQLIIRRDGEPERSETVDGPSSYRAQLDHLVAVCRGEMKPLTGGADSIATTKALLAIEDTARNGATDHEFG